MVGTLIGIFFLVIILGVLWWAILKIWPVISQYIAEPFATIAYVILVVILVLIVLAIIATLLGAAGIHVPFIASFR